MRSWNSTNEGNGAPGSGQWAKLLYWQPGCNEFERMLKAA